MSINRKERLIQNLASSILFDNSAQLSIVQKIINEDIVAIESEKEEKQERE